MYQVPALAKMHALVKSITETVIKESASLDQEDLRDPRAVIDLVKNRLNQEDMDLLIRRSGLRVAMEAADLSGRYQPAIAAYEAALRLPGIGSVSDSKESSINRESSSIYGEREAHPMTEGEYQDTELKEPECTETMTLTDAQGHYFRYSSERRDLMGGGLEKIPETQKRTVRLYVCSSFSGQK